MSLPYDISIRGTGASSRGEFVHAGREPGVQEGGFLAEQGVFAQDVLIFAVSIAAILDDSIGYELGRHQGRFSSFKVIHTA